MQRWEHLNINQSENFHLNLQCFLKMGALGNGTDLLVQGMLGSKPIDMYI